MIKRVSMLITILGFVLLWFGINQNNQILLISSLALIFTGVIGLYYGFNNMKGSMLFRNNNLFLILAGIIGLAVVIGVLLGL